MISLIYNTFIVLLTCVFSSACSALVSLGETSAETPKAIRNSIEFLSNYINVPEKDIEIVRYDPIEWPDACLGLAEPDEMCAQVITPGWQVILEVRGIQYSVRTDEQGTVFRVEE